MNMSKKFDKRKKVVYDLICDDLYTPMKFKELAMLLRVAKEDRDELRQILESLEQEGKITILRKKFELQDIAEADIVIAATNDHSLNGEIYDYCIEQEILVNVCNDKKKCDFYFPGLAMKDNVVVGVTANGTNHKMARKAVEKIREMLEEWL